MLEEDYTDGTTVFVLIRFNQVYLFAVNKPCEFCSGLITIGLCFFRSINAAQSNPCAAAALLQDNGVAISNVGAESGYSLAAAQ